jgi:hypothetical protein
MEVDAVVCWCDTTDKDYKRYREQDIGALVTEDTNRIGKRDELRFCLRGLYYNMPWLRKIYLVTWGKQFPEWLDEAECAKLNPPIIRIDQAILNNGKRMYGSLSVEACIHLIPNISEYFFYANSDMFVIKKMDKKDKDVLIKLMTRIQTEYNNYYSKLIIQRRVINISGLEKFKNVLNLCT